MRLLSNFVEGFEDYTSALPSPQLLRKWAAIAAVAGALERKVWLKVMGMELYPHLYTLLVAPPGVGKSVLTNIIAELWRSVSELHVAPSSVTSASLIDSLADATRKKSVIQENSIYLDFNSLQVSANELTVFLPAYEVEFMSLLTDLWDGKQYEQRRRSKDLHITIKRPQLNITAGTTPSNLSSLLPEGAWDQGFMSRMILVYSGQEILADPFLERESEHEESFDKLRSDIKDIANMIGPMSMMPDAQQALRAWHFAKGPPRPDHPKLSHYLTRRTTHLLKLCIIASAAESSDRIIRLSHYQTALSWLLEAESAMPDIFRALSARGDGAVIEEAYHFVYTAYTKTLAAGKAQPIANHRLVNFLSEKVPGHSVMRIIEVMEKGGRIQKQMTAQGIDAWKPLIQTF